jgi:hypothetical protein
MRQPPSVSQPQPVIQGVDLWVWASQVKEGKKPKFTLGVAEAKLGNAIQEQLGLPCACNEQTGELLRGVRAHAGHLTKVRSLASLQSALESSTATPRRPPSDTSDVRGMQNPEPAPQR